MPVTLVLTTRSTSSKSWSRKPLPRPLPGVGQECGDRPPADQLVKPVDALEGGEIGLQRIHLGAQAPRTPRAAAIDLGLVGDNHQVEAFAGAAFGELIADARGGAGDDGKRSAIGCHYMPPSMQIALVGTTRLTPGRSSIGTGKHLQSFIDAADPVRVTRPMLNPSTADAVMDVKDAAEYAGLTYFSDEKPGIGRKRSGKGFRYRAAAEKGQGPATLERIKALAVPPAWTDVWICPKANGHIQATGRDARGRKQYRYHARFREVRESTKYHHMLAFAESLPAIRARCSEHLALRGLPREKVLATVVHLLEATLIRVGSDEYAAHNKSYGLTTLKNRHVEVEGSALQFNFKGKSGKVWKLDVRDRRIAKVIRACQELPGQELFQYVDEDGETRDVTSSDVNAYLREISGEDITAKDFRTWHGTVLAAMALQEFEKFDSQAGAKRNIRDAIQTRGSAARQHARPSAGNATFTRKSSRPTSKARCCSRSRTRSRRSCATISLP